MFNNILSKTNKTLPFNLLKVSALMLLSASFLAPASADILYTSDFESNDTVISKNSYPPMYNSGNSPTIVKAEKGITPRGGTRMMKAYLNRYTSGTNYRTEAGLTNPYKGFSNHFDKQKEYWVASSIFIPKDWNMDYGGHKKDGTPTAKRLAGGIILQFHDRAYNAHKKGGAKGSWRDGLTLVVAHQPNGNFGIYNRDHGCRNRATCKNNPKVKKGNKLHIFKKTAPMKLGQWNDFVFNLKFSPNSDGFIKVWVNGNLVANEKGPNHYSEYDDNQYPYFKMGLYQSQYKLKGTWSKDIKWNVNERTIYHDELRIGDSNSSYKEVMPGGKTAPKDNQAPSVPKSLKVSNITHNSIKLNWAASTDNVGVSTYEIIYNNKPMTVTSTNTTLTGLTPNVNYSIKVRAKDAAGNKSAFSAPETAVTNSASSNPTLIAFAGVDKIFQCHYEFVWLGKAVDGQPATTDGATYHWTTKDGNIRAGVNSKVAEANKTGTYTLTVSKGGKSVSDTVKITHPKNCDTTPPVTKYTLKYQAETGGKITGSANQTINKGKSGTAVTAIANAGHTFVKWSDGKTSASRTDSNVKKNVTLSASFTKGAAIDLPPVITAVPTPIKTTINRWGAGYDFKPVEGADGYAIYSQFDNKKILTFIAAEASAFHCPENKNGCWSWTSKENLSGSGEWSVAARVDGVWGMWSKPVRFTVQDDYSAKPEKVQLESEKNLRAKSLAMPSSPEDATTLSEGESSGGGSFPLGLMMIGLLTLLRRSRP